MTKNIEQKINLLHALITNTEELLQAEEEHGQSKYFSPIACQREIENANEWVKELQDELEA